MGRAAGLKAAATMLVGTALLVQGGLWWHASTPLFELVHVPDSFERRSGPFTANVTGVTSRPFKYSQERFRYRLNDGPWRPIRHEQPRTPWPHFTVEMTAQQLRAGENELVVQADAYGRGPQREQVTFRYDPSPVELPARVSWNEDTALVADDGYWERRKTELGWRVGPKDGHAIYDKILVVTGAFAGGRRVEADVVFRDVHEPGRPYGFGVVPLWGGRPDEKHAHPRRGWIYALSWYMSTYEGIGNEFGYKRADNPRRWVNSYRNFSIEPGVPYKVVAEAWPERMPGTDRVRFRQRTKWWKAGEPEPEDWLELKDHQGATLPPGKYGVALLSFWAEVDFGPVSVRAIEPRGS
jgi:hypothetical protein